MDERFLRTYIPNRQEKNQMITVTVGHTKSGVLLMFDEPDAWTKVIRLSWHEAIGLKHAINEACDHPQFTLRDPRSQKNEVRFAGE